MHLSPIVIKKLHGEFNFFISVIIKITMNLMFFSVIIFKNYYAFSVFSVIIVKNNDEFNASFRLSLLKIIITNLGFLFRLSLSKIKMNLIFYFGHNCQKLQ